jgi:SAM-dependent methyltransferase
MNTPSTGSTQVICSVCNGASSYAGAKDSFRLYRCSRCSFLFVWPIPNNTLDVYSDDYFTGAKKGFGYIDYDSDKRPMQSAFLTYLDLIGGFQPKPGTLLDVGAASGFFLNLARDRGWQTCGIEPSGAAVEMAKQKGLDVRQGVLAPGVFAEGSFDVVTMLDVLEHIPDPAGALATVRNILRPGGLVAINTPDSGSLWARMLGMRWHLIVPPEHICLFSKDSLRKIVGDHGFEILFDGTIGKSFTIQYIVQKLATWQQLSIWKGLASAVSNRSVGNLSFPINLHDNRFVLARRV